MLANIGMACFPLRLEAARQLQSDKISSHLFNTAGESFYAEKNSVLTPLAFILIEHY